MSREQSEALFTGRAIAVCPELVAEIGAMPAIAVQQLYWLSRRTPDGWVQLTREQWGDEIGCDGSTASRTFAGLEQAGLVDIDRSGKRWAYRPRYRDLLARVPRRSLTPKAIEAALAISVQPAPPSPPEKSDRDSCGPPSLEGRAERQEERPQTKDPATTNVSESRNGGSGEELEHDLAQVEAALADSHRSPEHPGSPA